MASGLTTATAAATIDDILGTAARTAPTTPLKLAVTTSTPTAAAAGTELGSTTRPSIAFGNASSSPPVATNSAQVSVTCGASGTVTAVDIYDSAATPVRKFFAPLSASRSVIAGDTLVFAASAVSLTITSP